MIGRMTALAAVSALVLSTPAWAQEHRIEVSGLAGYTLSDGVSANGSIRGGDGNIYNRLDPKDSFSWGFTLGYHFNEEWELEFLYDQQQSTLTAGGTTTRDIGDFKVKNYHGVFSYNFGMGDSAVHPFLFLGAGATSYPGVNFTVAGRSGQTQGNSKFSGTFGLGIKAYPGHNVGFRAQARWTPTYIKSDSEGWWCDPYWGCYVVGDAQYSNQFAFQGGITLRF
jgi:hypothetical protein